MAALLRMHLLVAAAAAIALIVPGWLPAGAAPPDAGPAPHGAAPVCPGPAAPATARCHALVQVDQAGAPRAATLPSGYGPLDLQAAYSLPSDVAGSGQTIAIVDAYDAPKAESDLGVYRKTYGLPACTTVNGCFRKVNQRGGTTYPRSNQGWALEISLDLDMASAVCPNCKILLVEADSNSYANLLAAVQTAVNLGATAISNSWGSSEFSSEASSQTPFCNASAAGIAVTASSGDSGYGASFPAASTCVTAVGGTTLARSSSAPRGWAEVAWSGAGSGCSAFIAKPVWQTDTGCSNRTIADVSAVADPNTGVAVYDTNGYFGRKGWFVVGGTSASAPIIAGVFALAGNAKTGSVMQSYPYNAVAANPSVVNDVAGGSNGSCNPLYLCTAVAGYDGPTGLGTPNGSAGF